MCAHDAHGSPISGLYLLHEDHTLHVGFPDCSPVLCMQVSSGYTVYCSVVHQRTDRQLPIYPSQVWSRESSHEIKSGTRPHLPHQEETRKEDVKQGL